MIKHLLIAFVPLLLLLALPFALKPEQPPKIAGAETEKLVVISPNSESIRHEFEEAFKRHYREKFGRDIVLEWRNVGGTSDIIRYVNDRFEAVFREWWQSKPELGPWNPEIAQAYKSKDGGRAREIFLASDRGIGIDLMFGGGQYDHHKQAELGVAVDAGLLQSHPEWFKSSVIPQQFGGEVMYDPQGRYYGTCLATFGICYNEDRIRELGIEAPHKWEDLANPALFQNIALADPTKAGSITKCFEMLIQEQMQKTGADRDAGWANAVNLIKRIAANARYFTDSASKVPKDVASANAAAGMCIDFYGRSEAEWSAEQNGGVERIRFVPPERGTSLSADPIHLLRGAPNRKAAVEFIVFVLSEEGQKLWNYRLNTPGGPSKYVVRRLPIRRDMYTPEHRQYMADAGTEPYEDASGFVYDPRLTGRYFNFIRLVVKCFALDPMPELQAAWKAILDAGGPEKVPQAMAVFNRLPFSYSELGAIQKELGQSRQDGVLALLRHQRQWSESCRAQYREAARLAKEGK
jgi:ABC-type Fe3+ transport system substrate-binding protein